jgi:hypothetical protein
MNEADGPANLAELSKKSPAVTLIQMGTPFSPAQCQGFSLTWARLSKTVSLTACRGERQIEKEVQPTDAQIGRLLKLLAQWKISPVPESAYEAPCPAHDGGGFRAEAIGRLGINSYFQYACKNILPDGILNGEDADFEALTQLVDELAR